MDALIDYMFNKSVKDQFHAFNDGFHKVTGGRVLVRQHLIQSIEEETWSMKMCVTEERKWRKRKKNTKLGISQPCFKLSITY